MLEIAKILRSSYYPYIQDVSKIKQQNLRKNSKWISLKIKNSVDMKRTVNRIKDRLSIAQKKINYLHVKIKQRKHDPKNKHQKKGKLMSHRVYKSGISKERKKQFKVLMSAEVLSNLMDTINSKI